MSLEIEPMHEEGYLQTGKEVKEGFDNDNVFILASLNSPSIFGSVEYAPEEDRPVGIDRKRGYIHLCKPVINFTIAQGKASLLQKITHSDKTLTKEVVEFHTCYSVELSNYISVGDVTRPGGVPWGAEILKKWIDDFDVEVGVRECLIDVVGGYKKTYGGTGAGEFRRANFGGCLAVGDWRFFPADNSTYENLYLYVGTTVFYSDGSRLSYLINLQGHKSRLYSMIIEYVAVAPLGIRPDIASRHDQMSIAYDEIISANKNMKMIMSGVFDARTFAASYKRLSDKVYNLLTRPISYKSNRKSVIEGLASGQGDIRAKMLGKRVDYSGCSVIIIDPFPSIRKVKLPKNVTPKLFKNHLLSSMSNPNSSDWVGVDKHDECNSKLVSSGILDRVPVVIGHQSTLHKPSMQAFKAELTDERSLRINPLCVTSLNANFDGDQMWCCVPVSEGAIEEVKKLMSIGQNIYYPENSECSVMPRQGIIYRFNACIRAILQKGSSMKSYSGYRELFDNLFMQRMRVQDTVTLDGYTECAGRVAFAACLPKEVPDKFGIKKVTSKTVAPYVEAVSDASVDSTIDEIDRMIELGFKMGCICPPTLDLLDEGDISYNDVIEGFHNSMKEMVGYYERGLKEESAFVDACDKGFEWMEQKVKDTIYDHVGKESGFVRLVESGARGSRSDLTQMYDCRGRIQKSSRESFRAVIKHSYAKRLTPLEHFVTAYGGRQDLINKSLDTVDTDCAMRKMWHATSPYVITGDGCDTVDGVEIKRSDITRFIAKADEVESVFRKIIIGRYTAGSNVYISKEMARELSRRSSVVKIRSAITCEDPCCKKCYGDDPSAHRPTAIGLLTGFIAAQSIGEPGTQLSMDSFKKGDIASRSGVISAFEKLEACIKCKDLSKNKNLGSYNPVAWGSGEVHEAYSPDKTKKVTIGDSRFSKRFPVSAFPRKVAKKGEGLDIGHGDYDMKGLLIYTDVLTAQPYFIHTLYNIYKDENEVNMKHFEVLAAATAVYMVVSTDRDGLYVSQYHDSIQACKGSLANTVSVPTMKGVKTVQPSRIHALPRVIMESVKMGLASNVLLGLAGPLEYPLNRITVG